MQHLDVARATAASSSLGLTLRSEELRSMPSCASPGHLKQSAGKLICLLNVYDKVREYTCSCARAQVTSSMSIASFDQTRK